MRFLFVLIIALSLTGGGLVATVASYPVSVNGETLNVTVLNQNGSTFLPLKAVGQALGADVTWTGKSVEISTVDLDRLKEACVEVLAQNPRDGMQGSGVYIDYDEILTANHVVTGMDRFTVNGYIDLSLEDSNKDVDAAVLETPHKAKPVKIGDSDEVKIGDKVIIIAAPQDKEDTVEFATVTGFDPRGFVVMATMGAGASGGAVFDINGCLIGIIITADGTAEHVRVKNLVSPINDIREAL